MAFTPEQSAIRLTPEQEDQVRNLPFEEVKVYMAELALQQGLVVRDQVAPEVLIPTSLAENAPQRLAKTVVVNGQKHFVEGATEVELARAENDLYRKLVQESPQQTSRTEQPRDVTTGRFVERTDGLPVDREALDLQLQLGQISVADYIQRSGAVEEHLQQIGISADALKEVSNQKFSQSWEQATQEFLNSPAGRGWPGGTANLERLGQVLIENGWVDSPSATTIARAFEYMQGHNLVAENPELQLHDQLASAKDFGELRDYLVQARGGASGLFD